MFSLWPWSEYTHRMIALHLCPFDLWEVCYGNCCDPIGHDDVLIETSAFQWMACYHSFVGLCVWKCGNSAVCHCQCLHNWVMKGNNNRTLVLSVSKTVHFWCNVTFYPKYRDIQALKFCHLLPLDAIVINKRTFNDTITNLFVD